MDCILTLLCLLTVYGLRVARVGILGNELRRGLKEGFGVCRQADVLGDGHRRAFGRHSKRTVNWYFNRVCTS